MNKTFKYSQFEEFVFQVMTSDLMFKIQKGTPIVPMLYKVLDLLAKQAKNDEDMWYFHADLKKEINVIKYNKDQSANEGFMADIVMMVRDNQIDFQRKTDLKRLMTSAKKACMACPVFCGCQKCYAIKPKYEEFVANFDKQMKELSDVRDKQVEKIQASCPVQVKKVVKKEEKMIEEDDTSASDCFSV